MIVNIIRFICYVINLYLYVTFIDLTFLYKIFFSLLVTGSEDSTIFSFAITVTETYPVIVPIGFIRVPSGVTYLTWKPEYVNNSLQLCFSYEN